MPILLEYALLAILGSAPPTARGATPATPLTTPLTMTADCVGQPSGGAAGDSCSSGGIGLIVQATGGDKASKTKSGTGKKPVKHLESRRHHKGRRHGKITKTSKGTRNAIERS